MVQNGVFLCIVGIFLAHSGMIVAGHGDQGSYVFAEPVSVCPGGYVVNPKGECETLEYIEGSYSCGKGSERYYRDGTCHTIELADPEYTCADGALVAKGGKCVESSYVEPILGCQKGFELDAGGGFCVQKKKGKANYDCPFGYDLTKGECERRSVLEPTPTCPPGFVLELSSHGKAECTSMELAPPELSCPKHHVQRGGDCVLTQRTKGKFSSCPKGGKANEDGLCIDREVIPAERVCSELQGSVLTPSGGECEFVDRRPMLPRCKHGYVFKDNACQRDVFKPLHLGCPEGYKQSKHRGETVCSSKDLAEPLVTCPPGSHLDSKGKDCLAVDYLPLEYHCPHSNMLRSADGDTCVDTRVLSPTFKCPHGFKQDKDDPDHDTPYAVCTREERTEPLYTCPHGSYLLDSDKKHLCETVTPFPATPYCRKGTLTPNGCVDKKKKKSKFTCPSGHKKAGLECVSTIHREPNLLCPPDSVATLNGCETLLRSPPTLHCPKKYSLDARTRSCVLAEYAEPALICPPGYVLDAGSCYLANFTYNLKGAGHGRH